MGVLYFWLGALIVLIEVAIATALGMLVFTPFLRLILFSLGESIFRFIGVILIIGLTSILHFFSDKLQKKIIGDTFWGKWKKM